MVPKFKFEGTSKIQVAGFRVNGHALVAAAALSTLTPCVQARTKFEDTARVIALAKPSTAIISADREDISAVAKIRELSTYGSGWKGPGSVGPSDLALKDAEHFVRNYFSNPNFVRPRIGLASDGEINLFWKTEHILIDLSILGDGTYTYYAKCADGRSYSGDDVEISTNLPAEIMGLLEMAEHLKAA